jgi:hypothetical protein
MTGIAACKTPQAQRRRKTPACESPREIVMGHYDPRTVSVLAGAIDDICKALQDSGGVPLNAEMRQALAKRVLELFENGVTDPDDLRIMTIADSLWASSQSARATA